jgi:hypothetical protein
MPTKLTWPSFLILPLSVLPLSAIAHHSVSANFDKGSVIEIEGEVTEVLWRNPHVHMTVLVPNESGETVTWDIEATSLSNLRRWDISPDFLAAGDHIRIAGNPARRLANTIYAENILLPDGREAVLEPNIKPRWSEQSVAASARGQATEGDGSRPDLGFFRVWTTPTTAPMLFPENVNSNFDMASYPLTAAARAAVAAFDPIADSPTANCAPKGMPTIMEQPYPLEIARADGNVVLRLEEYDTVRTIYMGDEGAPANPQPSRLGRSVGRLEGNTLTVTTTGSDWPYFDVAGIPQSSAATIIEQFLLRADGSRLDYTVTVTDPINFTAPVTLRKYWIWLPGVEVAPYRCTNTG